jgi:hypothetical protein
MASWHEFVDAAPEFARRVETLFHSHSVDPPESNPGAWSGEAKLFGRAEELAGHERASDRFRVDIEQVVLTWLDSPVLAIETWTPQH